MSAINQSNSETIAEQVVDSAMAIQAVQIQRAMRALERGATFVMDYSPSWRAIADNLSNRRLNAAAHFAHRQAANQMQQAA